MAIGICQGCKQTIKDDDTQIVIDGKLYCGDCVEEMDE